MDQGSGIGRHDPSVSVSSVHVHHGSLFIIVRFEINFFLVDFAILRVQVQVRAHRARHMRAS